MAKKVKSHKPKKFNGIAFIGETPDKKDENSGVAFGGAVGEKIFKPLLASAGIDFADSLVTYVVPYRPERNKFYIHEQRHPELIEEGISDMHNLINEYEPTLIVPLGAVALKYTTTIAGSIEAHRGSIYSSVGFDKEYKVIPTFDPLYLASRYEDTVMSAFDMKRIAEESKFPEVKLRDRKYVLRPTFEQACELLKKTLEAKQVGYDIETQKNGHINCLGFSLSPDFAFCIPFMCEHGDYWTVEQEREIWKLVSEIMYSDTVQKVVHNFMFEGFMMDYYYDMEIRNVYDTMVASHVLYPELPNSLAFATSIFTKEPYYKDEGKGDRITKEDWDAHYKYNCKDNAVTIEIAENMHPMIIADELESVFWEEMQSAFCAVHMELDGMSVDTKVRTAGKNKLQELQDEAKEELVKLIGRDINPGSYKQVQELIYDEMGLPKKYKKNQKGGQSVATDVDALGELGFRFGHKELELIINYRKNQTAKSFYTYKLDPKDGKLRCSHNPTGQVGARWSTSKLLNGIGRNVQNFPKSAKGQFVASDGTLLMEIDLEQAESRIVALYSDCKRQLQIFEDGEDIHAITASHLFPDKTIEQCGKGTVERYLGKTMDHCLTGDHEVLTEHGWVPISKLEENPYVFEWNLNTQLLEFRQAKKVEFDYDGELIGLDGTAYSILGTPNHDIPYRTNNDSPYSKKNLEDLIKLKDARIPVTGKYKDEIRSDIDLHNYFKIIVMLQADAGQKHGNKFVLRFKKKRKINRCRKLLQGYEYTEKLTQGVTEFRIEANQFQSKFFNVDRKEFTYELLFLKNKIKKEIIEEVLLWDGYTSDDDRNRKEYVNTSKVCVDIIQALAHSTGQEAILTKCESYGRYATLYYLSFNKRKEARLSSMKISKVRHQGKVYCLETTNGFFMIRHKGKVSITGNSGNYGVGGLKLARKIYKETSKSEDTPTIKLEAGVVQGYLDGYHALYPEIKGKYWEDIKAELRGEGDGGGYARTLTNCFGRKRHFWSRLDDQNTLFEALNYKPQSIVAMIINKVINEAFINLYGQGVRPLVHTHDGCLFEIPKVDYMDYAEQINSYFDIPLHIGNHVAVIPAEAEIGESWGSMEELKFT